MKTSQVCLFLIVIVAFTACKSNTSEIFLPELTDIPFYENEHVVLDRQPNLDSFSNLPETAETLRDYLQDPSDFAEQVLPVLITYGGRTLVQEIDENRIVIADQMQHQLVVVNTETMDTTIVAKEGNGPGDVSFIEDIGFLENRMYVGMGSMKISVFNTDEMVTYRNTVNVEMPVSSLIPTDAGIFISGSPGFGRSPDRSKFEEVESISFWSEDGDKMNSFGKTYPLQGRFMLSRSMVSENIIRAIPDTDELILSYQNFPILYRYNTDGELLNTYKIDDFGTMVLQYSEEKRRISIPLDDFSQVTDLQFLDEEHLFIYTKTLIRGEEGNENRDMESIPPNTETRHFFHVLNIENDEYSFLGEITGEDTKFKVTPNFLFKIGQGEIIQIQR